MDVSDRSTEAYALDEHGEWVENWRMPTKQEALEALPRQVAAPRDG
jgi:hypothetical protein